MVRNWSGHALLLDGEAIEQSAPAGTAQGIRTAAARREGTVPRFGRLLFIQANAFMMTDLCRRISLV